MQNIPPKAAGILSRCCWPQHRHTPVSVVHYTLWIYITALNFIGLQQSAKVGPSTQHYCGLLSPALHLTLNTDTHCTPRHAVHACPPFCTLTTPIHSQQDAYTTVTSSAQSITHSIGPAALGTWQYPATPCCLSYEYKLTCRHDKQHPATGVASGHDKCDHKLNKKPGASLTETVSHVTQQACVTCCPKDSVNQHDNTTASLIGPAYTWVVSMGVRAYSALTPPSKICQQPKILCAQPLNPGCCKIPTAKAPKPHTPNPLAFQRPCQALPVRTSLYTLCDSVFTKGTSRSSSAAALQACRPPSSHSWRPVLHSAVWGPWQP